VQHCVSQALSLSSARHTVVVKVAAALAVH
jgi:hypothetical protein